MNVVIVTLQIRVLGWHC